MLLCCLLKILFSGAERELIKGKINIRKIVVSYSKEMSVKGMELFFIRSCQSGSRIGCTRWNFEESPETLFIQRQSRRRILRSARELCRIFNTFSMFGLCSRIPFYSIKSLVRSPESDGRAASRRFWLICICISYLVQAVSHRQNCLDEKLWEIFENRTWCSAATDLVTRDAVCTYTCTRAPLIVVVVEHGTLNACTTAIRISRSVGRRSNISLAVHFYLAS